MNETLLLAATLLLAPGIGTAQSRPSACGSLPEDIVSVTDYARYFASDTFAWLRADHITQIAPTDSQYIVTDSVTCQAVHDRAVQQLQTRADSLINLQPGGHDFTVFRFGPYLAIVLIDTNLDTSTEIVAEDRTSPILVFNASDLSYIFSFGT